MNYSPSEFVKNCWSLLVTKLFFPAARLIRRPVYIRGRKGMEFGRGFTTGYRCRFEMLSPGKVTLRIGRNCKIGDHVHMVASRSVTVGDDCLIASNVFISDTNHGNGNDNPMTPPDQWPLSSAAVSIGHRVWIGEGAAVLPGATIGDGCIIGAHAVVKGHIPAYSMVVGAPAKVMKTYNFDTAAWERC